MTSQLGTRSTLERGILFARRQPDIQYPDPVAVIVPGDPGGASVVLRMAPPV